MYSRRVFPIVCFLRIMLNKSLEDLHWGYDSMAFFFLKCILLLLFLMFSGVVRGPQASKLPNK